MSAEVTSHCCSLTGGGVPKHIDGVVNKVLASQRGAYMHVHDSVESGLYGGPLH